MVNTPNFEAFPAKAEVRMSIKDGRISLSVGGTFVSLSTDTALDLSDALADLVDDIRLGGE